MSELRVNIGADASGLKRELDKAKNNVAQFHRETAMSGAQVAQQAARAQTRGGRQLAEAGSKGARLAGAVSGIPGLGETGVAVATGAGAMLGLREAASVLGVGMLKAAGVVGVFIGAALALNKLFKEAYVKLQDALDNQLRTTVDENKQKIQTEKAYRKTLDDNRKSLTDSEYKRLRRGITLGDSGAMSEVRQRFGGTELNKVLAKELQRARIEAMPEGAAKSRAEVFMKSEAERESLRQRIGGTGASQATRAIASQIMAEINKEQANKLAEINAKQLEELKKINSNTKGGATNPFR